MSGYFSQESIHFSQSTETPPGLNKSCSAPTLMVPVTGGSCRPQHLQNSFTSTRKQLVPEELQPEVRRAGAAQRLVVPERGGPGADVVGSI